MFFQGFFWFMKYPLLPFAGDPLDGILEDYCVQLGPTRNLYCISELFRNIRTFDRLFWKEGNEWLNQFESGNPATP